MNTSLNKTLILLVCIACSACTTTQVPLNRTLVHQEKIDSVNVNQMAQNISTELASSKDFETIQLSTNVMSSNVILKNALTHYLEGVAFNDDLVINSNLDAGNEKSYLTPILTPRVVMSSDFGVVDVFLTASITQKALKNSQKQNQYEGSYSSRQVISSANFVASKETNKQYWLDNPVVLREKIVNGLYEVAEQFSEDFNGQ